MANNRQNGFDILSTILKNEQNIKIIEKYIYENTDSSESYKNLLYESIGFLTQDKSQESLKTLITQIHNKKFGWNNPAYLDYYNKLNEIDIFNTTPFEIEEGVLQCFKCNSKKTFSFQKQTRSADEGSTTFAQCAKCKHKWKHNN